MDAAAELAVMAKAKQVFEDAGSFLCFPAAGDTLSFRPELLDFSKALSDPATATALQDFSIAVSRCPADPILPAGQIDMLWDNYGNWLQNMVLATSNLAPASAAAYAAACVLLFRTDANGLRNDSPAVLVYKQYRDAAIAAEQAYKAATAAAMPSGTSESGQAGTLTPSPTGSPAATPAGTPTGTPAGAPTSTPAGTPIGSAAAQSSATNTASAQAGAEAALRSALDTANNDWATSGNKAAIEAAQTTVAVAEANMPDAVRAGWLRQYQPIIDHVTNAGTTLEYAPSFLNPTDLAAQSWNRMPPISAAEIAGLVAAAPKALRDLYGDVGSSQIVSITFEYRSAAIVRAWFDPKMFSYRFWTLPDGSRISDGAKPPAGTWPAYIAAVVFVRNVQVTYRTAAATPTPHPELLQFAGLRFQQKMPFGLVNAEIAKPAPALLPHPPPSPVAHPQFAAAALHLAPHPVLAAQPMLYRAMPTVHPMQAQAPAMHPMPLPKPILHPMPPPPPHPAPPPPSAASAVPAAAAPDNRISVLAYICRPTGRCPDPDPSLSWPAGVIPATD